jgi:hypothetical protein
VGLGKAQGFLHALACFGGAERASQSPHFAPQSIVGYTLHGSGAESRGEVWWSN